MTEHLELVFQEMTTDNQLFCQFDDLHGVLLLDVKNPFSSDDFLIVSDIINQHFETQGELQGLIIHSKKFPYWTSAQNRKEYLNFARDHHGKFKKVALGMGGFFVQIIAKIAHGRVHPKIKIFKYNQISEAQDWILHGK